MKTKKRAKKAGGVEERLRERDEAAADLAAELPEERAGLLAVAAEAVAACHAAVLASDGAAAEAAANRYDASIWKLNGGTYQGCKDGANPEAAGTLIELHCSAAPSVVPMWGQSGEFLMACAAWWKSAMALVRCWIGISRSMSLTWTGHLSPRRATVRISRRHRAG